MSLSVLSQFTHTQTQSMKKAVIDERKRPDLSQCIAMPAALQELLQRCWAAESKDRPGMSEVVMKLRAMKP